jgi:GT2 family glycosyltransferase/glycosyltransferase involved in cell wall biosynthesis
MTNKPSTKAVIYVHAKGCSPVNEHQVKDLLELDMPVCSQLAHEGLTQTENGYDQPVLLIAELARLFPDRPIIFMRAGLQPGKQQLATLASLLEQTSQPLALTLLSNADSGMNPFSGLQAPAKFSENELGDLVSLLAPGQLHTLNSWTDHFIMLSVDLVNRFSAETSGATPMQVLANAGGVLKVADDLFLHDQDSRVFTALKLQPHESAYPPPFSELSSRLQDWFNAGITQVPPRKNEETAATLHITHSWGGGVAQWLKSFIETDKDQPHLQLRSEDPQSDRGFGQKLSLYVGNELRCPIASWWLSPAIGSICDTSPAYQKILSEIVERYGIGRIFISSLVGHSLDALRTDLPTLQILHDHFPVWPLLSVSPEPYLQTSEVPNLELALQEHKKGREFPDKDVLAWSQIRHAYIDAITQFKVKIAAPGQSVLDMQNRLEPAFKSLATEIIAHGFPTMENLQTILPKSREDGRLRLVILGRLQTGKGQVLLSQALPELARHVQVYLLGSGKSGEAFFGVPGVDVILEYEHDKLSSILATIGPDIAALLSVVPETFSFTLSELQKMHIPTLATRVGSFPNRIEHGKTGWLIDAEPQALIHQVAALCDSPDQIEMVRNNLPDINANTLENMLDAYNRLCPLADKRTPSTPGEPGLQMIQKAAADYQHALAKNKLGQVSRQQNELRRELDQRTDWALKLDRMLKSEHKRAIQLAADLQNRTQRLNQLETEHQQLSSEHKNLSEQNTLMSGSASWKLTLPFRIARRVIKNIMLARAWNPARWPWLISQLVRNLSTLGIKGTLARLQTSSAEAVPEPQLTLAREPAADSPLQLEFAKLDQPRVSVIIPVYNNWAYTAACLHSLLMIKGKYSFEVIVVDDRSGDETAEKLEQIEGLTNLRNKKNLGFVGSCNHGAQHARGEYLVLLNNDTQVTEGWLDELIDTFEREPEAGLVGSRLVYPDGSLQESGGIIFNDGSGWNYGRGQQAENPKYNFLRESDYCSGACIILKTAYFHELGALDERYAPAYYEDTDLAFRVRESGLKVFVQPLSTIVHYEGITSGTDTSSGIKRYQLINQKKFLKRWKEELSQQPAAVSDPDNESEIQHASQHRVSGRILFIDATTPEPDKDSGSVRLTNLMQCCRALGYGVTFMADNRAYAGSYTRDLQRAGVEVLYNPWLESPHAFFRNKGGDFDYIFISRHYVAINYVSMIRRFCPETRFIFDTVDLHYLREQRLAELEQSLALKRTAHQTRRTELSVIRDSDATLVVSPVEKEVLAKDAPGEKVHVLSNIHEVPGRGKEFSERKDIYFVGGYQHPPNVDAACWFVRDIWPLIHAQLPNVQFHLIGSKAPERVRSLSGDNVIFHGFVESIQPFLDDCRLAVAPLRYGAGVKGKVNMSMAHGQPVVATPAAVEGMFAEHNREILVAEDAKSFADEVVRLYQDENLWNQVSDAAVQNVEEHFSLRAARDSLTALFDSFEL